MVQRGGAARWCSSSPGVRRGGAGRWCSEVVQRGGAARRLVFGEAQARLSPLPSALFRPCLRPSERVTARSVPSKPPLQKVAAGAVPGGGFDGTERAVMRWGGRKLGRNSADGCGGDRT